MRLLARHDLEHLSIDELGTIYRVHRATAARWLVRARRPAPLSGLPDTLSGLPDEQGAPSKKHIDIIEFFFPARALLLPLARRWEMASQASTLSILSWPSEDRPREKLHRLGPGGLTSAELMAVVLGAGEPRSGNALDLSRILLQRFGDLGGLEQAGLHELQEVGGIGEAKAARLLAALELGRRVSRCSLEPGAPLGSGEEVFRHYGPRLCNDMQEVFLALALDARNRLRREIVVARGTLTSCPVHPREVFRPLIREAAAACLLVHNHPSGSPEPSADDLTLTRRLVRAGTLLGITVLDHLIIGQKSFVSLAERGVVP